MPENFRALFTVQSVAGRPPFLASTDHGASPVERFGGDNFASTHSSSWAGVLTALLPKSWYGGPPPTVAIFPNVFFEIGRPRSVR
jgi:hypothetical protein